jgi:hypothetical protein
VRFVGAAVEAEWGVFVRHQSGVGNDAQDPAVEANDEIEQSVGIAAGEQKCDRGDEYERTDEPGPR